MFSLVRINKKIISIILTIIIFTGNFLISGIQGQIENLPNDIIRYNIFKYLDPQTLLNMRKLNKNFKNIISETFDLIAEENYINHPSVLAKNIYKTLGRSQAITTNNKLQLLTNKLILESQKKLLFKDNSKTIRIFNKEEAIKYFSDHLNKKINLLQTEVDHIKRLERHVLIFVTFFLHLLDNSIKSLGIDNDTLLLGIKFCLGSSIIIFLHSVKYFETKRLDDQKRMIQKSIFGKEKILI